MGVCSRGVAARVDLNITKKQNNLKNGDART